MCNFKLAYIGECPNQPIENEKYCAEHYDVRCMCCGALATHQCDATFGLVCGCDLCDDCEHEISSRGTSVCDTKHVKKDEQKYHPWYAEDEMNFAKKQLEDCGKKIEVGRKYEVVLFVGNEDMQGTYEVICNKYGLLYMTTGVKLS